MLRRAFDKTLGVGLPGSVKDSLASGNELGRPAMVDSGRGHQIEAGMVVLVVVPGKELLAEAAGIFDRAEAVGEARTVFQGFELRL